MEKQRKMVRKIWFDFGGTTYEEQVFMKKTNSLCFILVVNINLHEQNK
jgi:hypothetical protein